MNRVVRNLILSFAVFGCSSCSFAPSDDALISEWKKQKSKFTELVSLALKDENLNAVWVSGSSWTRNERTVSPGNMKRYKQLLSDLGLFCVRRSDSSTPSIELDDWSQGILEAGEAKGYCYTAYRITNLVPSLDKFDNTKGMYLRHIEGSWFLFYEGPGE